MSSPYPYPYLAGVRGSAGVVRYGGEEDRVATVDAQLLEILACPCPHHAPLSYDQPAQTLACQQCRRVFPIQDGIPVLLLDEAFEDEASEDGVAGQGRHG